MRCEQQFTIRLLLDNLENFAQQEFENASIQFVNGKECRGIVVNRDEQAQDGDNLLDALGFKQERDGGIVVPLGKQFETDAFFSIGSLLRPFVLHNNFQSGDNFLKNDIQLSEGIVDDVKYRFVINDWAG